MTVSTQNFSTLVSNMAAAVQARASQLVDLTIGSILRAVIEACAAAGLWLQSLVLQVAALTRLATSTGSDADSFVNDFGFSRVQAVGSTGPLYFSRATATSAATVPVGTQAQTADGTQTFQVTADSTNSAWNGSNGYTIPAGTVGITIPSQATTVGSASNVLANTVTLILSAIPYVNFVTNPSAMSGGADAQSDASLRVAFQNFIASLASATRTAINSAIADVPGVVAYNVGANVNPDGSSHPGYLTIVINDGTGNPSSTLIAAVQTAVSSVVADGITFGVFGPAITTANVAGTITVASGYVLATVEAQAEAAVSAYIASLGLGVTLAYTRLYQVIYDASPGITEVTGLTLNGGTSDLVATLNAVIAAGTVSIG
jgi:uncharacterized phage protein gp47/JayE